MSENERRVTIAFGLTQDEAWDVLTNVKIHMPGIQLNADERKGRIGFCLFATWNDKTVEALHMIDASEAHISLVVEGVVTQAVVKALAKAIAKSREVYRAK